MSYYPARLPRHVLEPLLEVLGPAGLVIIIGVIRILYNGIMYRIIIISYNSLSLYIYIYIHIYIYMYRERERERESSHIIKSNNIRRRAGFARRDRGRRGAARCAWRARGSRARQTQLEASRPEAASQSSAKRCRRNARLRLRPSAAH